MRSGGDDLPINYVESGDWPDVVLVPDAPLSAYAGLVIARRLAAALEARGLTSNAVAIKAGISPQPVREILAGNTTVRLSTLVRLEQALRARLYPAGIALKLHDSLRRTDLDALFPLEDLLSDQADS